MFDRFTERARKVINLARQEAQVAKCDYIGTEHMLYGLLLEGGGIGAQALVALKVDLRKLRVDVSTMSKTGTCQAVMGQVPFTPRAKKCLELAVEAAQETGCNYVGTEHLLLGLIGDGEDGLAAQALLNVGVTRADIRSAVVDLLGLEAPSQSSILDELHAVHATLRRIAIALERAS